MKHIEVNNQARRVLRVGDKVITNASGEHINQKDLAGNTLTNGDPSTFIHGIIGEITDSSFYIWQNERFGTVGRIKPSNYTGSWKVTFEGQNGRWVKYSREISEFVKILSADPFDERLIMENTEILKIVDASGERPIFKISNIEKWNTLESELEKIGEIEYVDDPS